MKQENVAIIFKQWSCYLEKAVKQSSPGHGLRDTPLCRHVGRAMSSSTAAAGDEKPQWRTYHLCVYFIWIKLREVCKAGAWFGSALECRIMGALQKVSTHLVHAKCTYYTVYISTILNFMQWCCMMIWNVPMAENCAPKSAVSAIFLSAICKRAEE